MDIKLLNYVSMELIISVAGSAYISPFSLCGWRTRWGSRAPQEGHLSSTVSQRQGRRHGYDLLL